MVDPSFNTATNNLGLATKAIGQVFTLDLGLVLVATVLILAVGYSAALLLGGWTRKPKYNKLAPHWGEPAE